jgi:hypothetical protein
MLDYDLGAGELSIRFSQRQIERIPRPRAPAFLRHPNQDVGLLRAVSAHCENYLLSRPKDRHHPARKTPGSPNQFLVGSRVQPG